MDIALIFFTILGLSIFEIVSSVDNAVINAEVLSTMGARARRWFLRWGILFAVFVVRGTLPWLIIYFSAPSLGPIGAFTAAFSNDPAVAEIIEHAAPLLLMGGGVFLVLLFLHWLFLEKKTYGLPGERFLHSQGVWFFAIASVFLSIIVWYALRADDMLAFSAVLGSTAFFITHGFKEQAETAERELKTQKRSDIAKILFLEVIDLTFSIDGVLGAFAFTLSVPLILLGNGIGAIVLRWITVSNIDRIKKYALLKNGAMYSIAVLGAIMVSHGFGAHIPEWVSPLVTLSIIGLFFMRARKDALANRIPA